MRSIIATIMSIAVLCGALRAGEMHPSFLWVEAEGVVYVTASSKISYATGIAGGKQVHALKVAQRVADGEDKEIDIAFDVAQVLAEEVEPYVMLMKRGRGVDEVIEHPGGVSLTISSKEASLGVRITERKAQETTIDLAGDFALIFLDTLLGFPGVAETWAAATFGKAPAVAAAAPASDEQFPVTNLTVRSMPFGDMHSIQGRLTNNSGQSHDMAMLKISFFDDDGALLGAANLFLQNLRAGETVTIEGVTQDDIRDWATYSIRLEIEF